MAVLDINSLTFGEDTYNLKDPTKVDIGSKGVPGGVAELDANGKVPVSQCPIEEDAAQATTDWLDAHIAQETGYVIDDSLTISGAAADAKKVGDEVGYLKSAIGTKANAEKLSSVKAYTSPLCPQITWSVGDINGTNGNSQSSSIVIRCSYIPMSKGTIVKLLDTSLYEFQTRRYNASTYDKTNSIINWTTQPYKIPSNGTYRFIIHKKDRSEITEEEVESISAQFSITIDTAIYAQENKLMWSADEIEYNPELFHSGYYAKSGSPNRTKLYLTTVYPLPKWIHEIKPPAGHDIYILAYDSVTQEYAGEWNGSSLKKTDTLYQFTDWVEIPDTLKNGNDIYLCYSKIDNTVYDSELLFGTKIKTEYSRLGIKDTKSVTTTVLGADLPSDLSPYDITNDLASAMKEAIDQWSADYAGDDRKIPFIVHTDQHGRLQPSSKGFFDLLSYLVNWDNVSAIFNLGDTVWDHWSDDDTNTDPLLRNGELEEAIDCIAAVPANKQINVFGNHDTWYTGTVPSSATNALPSLKYLNPYFKSTGLRTVRMPDNSGLMEVYDDIKGVRYLIIADWDYAAGPQADNSYFFVSADHWRWIIAKMAENTGYDLVIVSHVPLVSGSSIAYNPITHESATKSRVVYFIYDNASFSQIWSDRKNKVSGSINVRGESIPYDFTQCTDKCLCSLSGHVHNDVIDYTTSENGLQCVSFDWFANRTIHFGLIDRDNNQIKVWKLSYDDSTPAVQAWTAPFDYSGT